jgi:2,3-dihydroxybenzoate-AMP ligase
VPRGARPDDPVEIRRYTLGSVIGAHDEVVVRRPGTDDEVPDGDVGELTFRGPSVIRSYLAREHTAGSFTADGFLRTGDLGRAHVIGDRRCYTLDGRLKDQISRGGEKFMADELELLLHDHPDVREVAAIGVPDATLGERVCVVVIPQPASRDLPPEELRRRLVEYLDQRDVAKYKWPERLVLVHELPRTGTGKVRKDVLRDRVASDHNPDATTDPSPNHPR